MQSQRFLPTVYRLLFLTAGTLLLIWPALYNGFPLVYSDSGTYINSSIHLETPADRPLFYGIFLRITAMQAVLWIPVVVQGVLTTWLLQQLMRVLFPAAGYTVHFIVLFALAMLTGLPWYTAQLMPDLFTALLPVLVYLLLFDPTARWKRKTAYWLLLFVSTGMHLSNVFILLLLVVIPGVMYVRKWIKNRSTMGLSWLMIVSVMPLVLLTHSCFTYARFDLFRPSAGSNLFLAAKCLESPLLKTYMRENQHRMDIPFSEEIDSIPDSPMGFLWSPESPLNRPGTDQIAISQQYDPVLSDMLTTPRYLKLFLRQSLEGTAQQLLFHKIGAGLMPYRENSNPGTYIRQYFETEWPAYKHARQFRTGLERNYHDWISGWIFYVSIAVIIGGWLWKPVRQQLPALLALTLGCVIANAFITASLANVYDRLQVRVVWLLTFAAIAVIIRWWYNRATPGSANRSQW